MTDKKIPKSRVSVIVPVLDDIEEIKAKVLSFKRLKSQVKELIFVDGGSVDGSYEYLCSEFKQVLKSEKGRATQMNQGADASTGDWLLFLHVDSELESVFNSDSFEHCVNAGRSQWGYFKLRLSGRAFVFRLIERAIRWRSKVFNVATGDQALFFHRAFFRELGCYPNIELMEDVAISRKAKCYQAPLPLSVPVLSSSRRWEKEGVFKTIFLMWYFQLLFKCGVSPKILAEKYYATQRSH